MAGLLLLFLAACGGASAPEQEPLSQVDRSPDGVVSAAHPEAARAGAQMLELGGNAVDAAVAAAFTLAVVEPSMSGLGGRVQILIRTADGSHVGIDGTTQAPAAYDPDAAPQASYGYPVIGIPGVPAGLLKAHTEHGTLPRSTVMGPAIRAAEEGFRLLPGEAGRQASRAEELAEFEGSSMYFLRPDGTPHPAGTTLRQPDLARTLRAIEAGGADAFYRGEIARTMAADIQAHGGAVTVESLAAYEALDSEVVYGDYRGYDLVGLWLPSFGAITVEILELMEQMDLDGASEADWALALSEAIRVAYLDRPEQEDLEDAARLTSDEWARERASLMRREVAGTSEPWEAVTLADDGHTTHLTTADRDGMMVALTQSLGPAMGSRVATPGLGFVYAATLGGYLGRMEGGARARSHISPFMVEEGGEPRLALGAAGGGRIPTAIAAVVSRIIDRGMSLEEALQAPRIVPRSPRFSEEGEAEAVGPVTVEIETGMGFSTGALEAMRGLGWTVEEEPLAGRFGRVHAVRWLPDEGTWEGAADPDWEGAVATPRELIR